MLRSIPIKVIVLEGHLNEYDTSYVITELPTRGSLLWLLFTK